jgi:hypothetical protein
LTQFGVLGYREGILDTLVRHGIRIAGTERNSTLCFTICETLESRSGLSGATCLFFATVFGNVLSNLLLHRGGQEGRDETTSSSTETSACDSTGRAIHAGIVSVSSATEGTFSTAD